MQPTGPATAESPSTWRIPRWLAFSLASLLLIAVAGRQFYLTQTSNLTPWLGGGFGMFATIDRIDHRVTRAYLLTTEGDVPIEVPTLDSRYRLEMKARIVPQIDRLPGFDALRDLQRLEMKARAMPTPQRLAALAESIAAWDQARDLVGQTGDGDLEVRHSTDSYWHGVRVEVWRLEFDSSSRELTARPLAEFTHVGNQEGRQPVPMEVDELRVESEPMP